MTPARTVWASSPQTPLRRFLRTQTGSAAFLLAGTVAALAWANLGPASYQACWHTTLTVAIGHPHISLDLRSWINSGLMTFFFLVVGLEARREFDMGELRERRRLMLPLVAGLAGMAVPIAIYLAVNAGRPSLTGWGAAASTDTAFALGMLALASPRAPDRLRTFLLTFSVVDDLVALVIIAIAYSAHISLIPLGVAVAVFVLVYLARRAGLRYGLSYIVLGLIAWTAFLESGVDPVVTGLLMGLLSPAYAASRTDLAGATEHFRLFREQPTPELARRASLRLATTISPNERLQESFHPWTSFLFVPLFALANAGVTINGAFLARAYTSPVTLGIAIGYIAGKPIGVVGASWLLTRLTRGRLRPPAGWASVTGAGTIAGIGFTVSLLIASLAFHGSVLADAKVGVLTAALGAALLTALVFRIVALLPTRRRIRALLGTSRVILDLAVPVDPRRDHIRGPQRAPVTVVEYGDFECPYCGRAEPTVRALLADHGDVRYVWRHLPLPDVHPHAQLAAEASEAAAAQGAFWEMHDLLLGHQRALLPADLIAYATDLGLDTERFTHGLRTHAGAARIAEDTDSADLSGVSGTPTFFVNGQRYYGEYDIDALSSAVKAARARALLLEEPTA